MKVLWAIGLLVVGWGVFVVLIVVSQSWAFDVACTAYTASIIALLYITALYWTRIIRPGLRRPHSRPTGIPAGNRTVSSTQQPPQANTL